MNSIKIDEKNPWYWNYKGKTSLLIGGSKEDNLFQIEDVEEHLHLLYECGGNYVRCTMSSRDDGNVWPFEKNDDGIYDLNKPSKTYWSRLDKILEIADKLDIIVQIEIWDRFDLWGDWWQDNPFNPKINCNYTCEESNLQAEYTIDPWLNKNKFFFSIPKADNNILLLKYQENFVSKLLERTLNYPNVLYCIDNETSGIAAWGEYWAEFIRKKASKVNKEVQITEMWDEWDITHKQHRNTFDKPNIYSFCEISQNTHNSGDKQWENIGRVKNYIKNSARPLNSVKTYGFDGERFGTTRDGIERFFKNVLGGLAATRFHRPPAGLGLTKIAQNCIRSARLLEKEVDLFSTIVKDDLILERKPDSCYCVQDKEGKIIVFFTSQDDAKLKLSGSYSLKILDTQKCIWVSEQSMQSSEKIVIHPISDYCIAVLENN